MNAGLLGPRLRNLEEPSDVVAELESDGKGVPVLLRQYLQLGGTVLGFNVDRAFSDVVDGLMVVDLARLAPAQLQKYLGPEGATAFREHHATLKNNPCNECFLCYQPDCNRSRAIKGCMRCDLHVHTIHSGMCTVPLLNRICRESYNDPREVYETLKQRGMDLVTVSDHDSIDAVESLRRHPDFFLSEEVSCRTSSGTLLHVGVYGIEERDHGQMQRRRDDFPSFLAYLRERGLLFSVNHVFSGLTGSRTPADFEEFVEAFPAVETRNGHMRPLANRYAQEWAASTGKVAVGGSDSAHHALSGPHLDPGSRRARHGGVPGRVEERQYRGGRRIGRLREAHPRPSSTSAAACFGNIPGRGRLRP